MQTSFESIKKEILNKLDELLLELKKNNQEMREFNQAMEKKHSLRINKL